MKQALLGLVALERTIDRQRSRMKWLKEGDSNTKLFQAVANGRRSKNFIAHVKKDGVLITDQELKEKAFFEAYERLIGSEHAREHSLDLQYLGIQPRDLSELEIMITEEEFWSVIKELTRTEHQVRMGSSLHSTKKRGPLLRMMSCRLCSSSTRAIVGDLRS